MKKMWMERRVNYADKEKPRQVKPSAAAKEEMEESDGKTSQSLKHGFSQVM